jgi:CRP-like cAMP-binding protein
METLERILGQHPFFKDLSPENMKLVTGCAANVRFEPDQYVFHEGDEANQFYLIREGRIALQLFAPDRGHMTLETLGEGDVLGWSWLIPPYYYVFDAKVLELTRAIALDGKCLRRKCEDDHHLGFELLKRFSSILENRLATTRLQLLDLYGVRS